MNDLMDIDPEAFSCIKDLGLAAALVTTGFKVIRTQAVSKSVYFIFSRSPELDKSINDYWSDTLILKARTYFDNTKMLKTRIYNRMPS